MKDNDVPERRTAIVDCTLYNMEDPIVITCFRFIHINMRMYRRDSPG